MTDWDFLDRPSFAVIGILLIIVIFLFGLGWAGVHYTKTVGKANQNAKTEVFRSTDAYIAGQNNTAMKLYREWKMAEPDNKKPLCNLAQLQFADVDLDIIKSEEVRNWLKTCE
jgi:hypothetical protein